jgi:hypothetical protein
MLSKLRNPSKEVGHNYINVENTKQNNTIEDTANLIPSCIVEILLAPFSFKKVSRFSMSI